MTQEKFETSIAGAIGAVTTKGSADVGFIKGQSNNAVDTNIDQGEKYSYTCKVGPECL
jgi:hypothetical protein